MFTKATDTAHKTLSDNKDDLFNKQVNILKDFDLASLKESKEIHHKAKSARVSEVLDTFNVSFETTAARNKFLESNQELLTKYNQITRYDNFIRFYEPLNALNSFNHKEFKELSRDDDRTNAYSQFLNEFSKEFVSYRQLVFVLEKNLIHKNKFLEIMTFLSSTQLRLGLNPKAQAILPSVFEELWKREQQQKAQEFKQMQAATKLSKSPASKSSCQFPSFSSIVTAGAMVGGGIYFGSVWGLAVSGMFAHSGLKAASVAVADCFQPRHHKKSA